MMFTLKRLFLLLITFANSMSVLAAEGHLPNQFYPANELFTRISPQLSDRHHNQPSVINGYLLLAGNAEHEFWDLSDPYNPALLSELISPYNAGEAESHQVSYAKFPDGSLYLVDYLGPWHRHLGYQ